MREACVADLEPFTYALATIDEQVPPTARVCATSTCGKYLTLACGFDIYTYQIEGLSLSLISKTSCEKRVLAVTIDAGSNKFVIAALLEGRIGLYVDLCGVIESKTECDPWESAGVLNNTSPTTSPIMDFGDTEQPRSNEVIAGDFDELSVNAASFGETTFLHQSVEIVTQRTWAEYFHAGCARVRGLRHLPRSDNGVWPNTLNFNERRRGKQAEARPLPQIVYRNICFDDDPAISIAISPTRQCVAFGCKSGVELYWVCDDFICLSTQTQLTVYV